MVKTATPALLFYRPQWLIVTAIIVALSWGTPAIISMLPDPVEAPSPLKPYADLRSFRPRYQNDHQDATSVNLHATGTTLILLVTLMNPELIFSAFLAAQCGRIAFEVFRHHDHGIAEALVALVVFFTTTRFLRGSILAALGVLLLGYSFAWVGHFFYEGNRPATFIYPTYSLICDFLMWAEVVTGATVAL